MPMGTRAVGGDPDRRAEHGCQTVSMNAPQPTQGVGASWLSPAVDEQGLARYATTLRERKWLILATVLVTTLAAVIYLATATKVYEAEADILITPVDSSDPVYSSLGLIHDSSDPTRDVETASRLITTNNVARRVKVTIHYGGPSSDLQAKVTVEPVAQSNIVSIIAEGDSPRDAQRLANAFATQAVADRTAKFHQALDRAITNLEAQVPTSGPGSVATDSNSLPAQLNRMKSLKDQDDPTVRVETLADLPTDPSSPKPKLTIAAAIIAGLVLGIGGAFALQVLDPRLRREEQLRRLYGLPILARIPKDSRAHGAGALAPEMLSPSTIEAYRTLRATLAASRGRDVGATSILVTSPSPSEGKTTTGINLASSLALAGNRVVLIEADLRRPAVRDALGVEQPEKRTGSVLPEAVDLEDALFTTKAYGSYLQLLLADYSGAATGWMADRLFLPAASQLIDDAKELADYVIIDSPPLSEVIDALQLAQRADEALVVVRLGKTHLAKLANLSELLARHGVQPVGFAVVGAPTPGGGSYYYLPQRPTAAERKARRT